jgi:5-methyltetrahydrofolate--homocysteine methyltransferase
MNKHEFRTLVSQGQLTLLDGATGTQLALRGMPQGVCPEQWVLENPQAILDIQRAYFEAGSSIVYAPTFGGNRIKLAEFGLEGRVEEINRELAGISRRAADQAGGFTFGDLAPTGRFVEPFGELPFEEAVAIYAQQIKALQSGGVDGLVIETMMDIQETRAALIAARETCDLPVMVSMTFDKNGRTLTGSDPVSALITLQSLGADAVGCNCSTGPAQMLEVIRLLKPYATVPLLAKPNAGMPRLVDGETVFDMQPNEYAGFVSAFIEAGVNLLGGCCGTSPAHIAAVRDAAAGRSVKAVCCSAVSAVSSARRTHFCSVGAPFTVIGERINPTGKKALQAELREGRLNLVQQFARQQQEGGARVLDVNMGLSGIDEGAMMCEAVRLLSQTCELPLCIDSTDPAVIERALRLYPGRALVNSVSAERDRLEKTLPLVARYGAMFVLLPLNDEGIPATLDERKDAVRHVIAEAQRLGLHQEDITVDGLVMTISSDAASAGLTLDLIEWCSRELNVNTVCGLSNVSFGLPERKWVNGGFLAMAIGRGLTMAIANPASELTMSMVAAADALTGRDANLKNYIARFSAGKTETSGPLASQKDHADEPGRAVYNAVVEGDTAGITEKIRRALDASLAPRGVVDEFLIPAIEKVGELYERQEYFLPQLIMSADTMREGFGVLKPLLAKEAAQEPLATVVLATVQGDVHDIGKNIVGLMLQNYGFRVVDLGKDVPAEKILDAAQENEARLVGLSALMTTTMINMRPVIALAKERGMDTLKFMVGGAVVDQHFADEIGADGYAEDAMAAVRLARVLISHDG